MTLCTSCVRSFDKRLLVVKHVFHPAEYDRPDDPCPDSPPRHEILSIHDRATGEEIEDADVAEHVEHEIKQRFR